MQCVSVVHVEAVKAVEQLKGNQAKELSSNQAKELSNWEQVWEHQG